MQKKLEEIIRKAWGYNWSIIITRHIALAILSSPDLVVVERKKTGDISDGYHTFDELYNHRCHLFVALMRSNPAISWRANNHDDGSNYPSWFVAGMHLPTGDISYHLPQWMWTMLDGKGIATTNKAPKWDGHTAEDVIKRLAKWCEGKALLDLKEGA